MKIANCINLWKTAYSSSTVKFMEIIGMAKIFISSKSRQTLGSMFYPAEVQF